MGLLNSAYNLCAILDSYDVGMRETVFIAKINFSIVPVIRITNNVVLARIIKFMILNKTLNKYQKRFECS